MRFTSDNARNFQAIGVVNRRKNTAARIAKLQLQELNYLKSLHPTTYVEDRLINLRAQLIHFDNRIFKTRDARRVKDLAIAMKFLNDQERALSRPMTLAEQKEIAKAAKQRPAIGDGI